MKLPKAKKLPSGRWNIQIQINNQRYSVTADTKKQVQDKAKEIYAGAELEKRIPLTVGKAIDNYISEKTGILSPSTIKGYMAIRKNYLQKIMDLNISDLTQSDIQRAVSSDSMNGKSPKTIRNAHGLLAAVLKVYRPNFNLVTRLPQKEKTEMRIFSEDEMALVWKAAKGSAYELPILLASWLGLRMSEIRGIKYEDVKDGRLHIHRAVVSGPYGDVEKGPKTTSGDRWIKIPKVILNLIHQRLCEFPEDMDNKKILSSYICPYADITIYKNFIKICEKAGVEPCRFHDLRHFAASEAHAVGVPDKYSMKRMGHKTDNMLKTVYQHTLQNREDEFSDKIDEKMRKIYESADKNADGN